HGQIKRLQPTAISFSFFSLLPTLLRPPFDLMRSFYRPSVKLMLNQYLSNNAGKDRIWDR
ncbi:MAG: hypothetical protein P4M02_08870, partial [Clostridia bacterium]|nr:hypothetical protein [Clostridia bacterium]